MNFHIEVTGCMFDRGKAFAFDTESLPGIGTCRNIQPYLPIECRRIDLDPENSIPRSEIQIVIKVASFNSEIRIRRKACSEKQITGLA